MTGTPPRELPAHADGGIPRERLAPLAALSALSLAAPATLVLMLSSSGLRVARGDAPVLAGLAIIAVAYALVAMRARRSGGALIAGVATALGLLAALAMLPAALLTWVDAATGGNSSRGLLAGTLLFSALQFAIAAVARALPGSAPRADTRDTFRAGLLLPVAAALVIGLVARLPQTMRRQQHMTDHLRGVRAREELLTIHACATAHRVRDPRASFPPTLQALGPAGDRCLSSGLATGALERWRFDYAPVSANGIVTGFTLRAGPDTSGTLSPELVITEHGIVRHVATYASSAFRLPEGTPGLNLLSAMRECDRLTRAEGTARAWTLQALHAYAGRRPRGEPDLCAMVEHGGSDWRWYRLRPAPDTLLGDAYHVAIPLASRGRADTLVLEARPRRYGITGVWSYLSRSPGDVHATLENRAASAADPVVPRCVYAAPPTGAAQCVMGTSPAPTATLRVDSIVDAAGFTVGLVGVTDSLAAGAVTTLQYSFNCGGGETADFTRDSTRRCRAPWHATKVRITATVRNGDFAARELTRDVAVRQPPTLVALAPPAPIELGDVLELTPVVSGRDPRENVDYVMRIGSAPPTMGWIRATGTTMRCRAATTTQGGQCTYPAVAGTWPVTLTVRSRFGDSSVTTTELRVLESAPVRLPPGAGPLRVGRAGDRLTLELLVRWPAEHGAVRSVRDAINAGDLPEDPPRIGTVAGTYADQSHRAADGRTAVRVVFDWSHLLQARAITPTTRELVVQGRHGHVRDHAPYRQVIRF